MLTRATMKVCLSLLALETAEKNLSELHAHKSKLLPDLLPVPQLSTPKTKPVFLLAKCTACPISKLVNNILPNSKATKPGVTLK